DPALQAWLASAERAGWVEKLRARLGEFELKTLPGGFSFWFTQGKQGAPPAWKMVLAVLIALYPLVMLQTFERPYVAPLGLALSALLDCIISVALLQWVLMPLVTKLLRPWLYADASQSRLSLGGLGAILVFLVVVILLFRLITS